MKQGVQTRKSDAGSQNMGALPNLTTSEAAREIEVSLLTGGGDKPYAFGLATELMSKGAVIDLIGSDDLDCPEFHGKPYVRFLNLRGDQHPNVGFVEKSLRVLKYYAKLIRYTATAEPKLFHILWNNKFLAFDRTLLMLYYKLLGKMIVLTVHNVNAGTRDSNDTGFNRFTLRFQYRHADHIFIHTEQMKLELLEEFGVQGARVSVIPFGINNAVPNTSLSPAAAKQRLSILGDEKTILFFGNIAPYKGLKYLIEAFQKLLTQDRKYRLIIAGRPKECESYWSPLQEALREDVKSGRVLLRADYVPDEETEVYFKAADVLVLPYTHVYQSGVLFLGYSFGLPILAADVGALKREIVEGKTGFVFRSADPVNLATTIEQYFASDLYANLSSRRQEIRQFAIEGHSWDLVGRITMSVYANLLGLRASKKRPNHGTSKSSLDVEARS